MAAPAGGAGGAAGTGNNIADTGIGANITLPVQQPASESGTIYAVNSEVPPNPDAVPVAPMEQPPV